MACPYLKETNHSRSSCVTKENFHPDDEYLTNFCENPNKFKECATFKEWTRIQMGSRINKFFTSLIPILFYLNILSILLTLEIITINDWMPIILGFVGSVVISWKAQ